MPKLIPVLTSICGLIAVCWGRTVDSPMENRNATQNAHSDVVASRPAEPTTGPASIDDHDSEQLLRTLAATPAPVDRHGMRVIRDTHGNVEVIDLSELAVTSRTLQLISRLHSVRDLRMRSLKSVGDLSPLAKMPGLRDLELDSNVLGPRSLAGLEAEMPLEVLSLMQCSGVPQNLKYLARLTKLRQLSLVRTDITNADLLQLSRSQSLFYLSLEGTTIDRHAIGAIGAIPKLHVVLLPMDNFSDRDQQVLRALRPDLLIEMF